MDLYSELRLGPLQLKNRIVMAPLTRCRAVGGNVPHPLAASYYSQRASAGLIITEATQVSPQGVGYVRTPGIHSGDQVRGWRRVVDAVHRAGAPIFLQLWHVGRVSHPDFHGGELPVAPSPIAAQGLIRTPHGRKPFVAPRALEASELPGIVEQFREGAVNALEAGFDGVEVHGANGYLLDQFVEDGTNQRTDRYGGSIANRMRLPLEVTDAVTQVWGPDRVGYRISPNGKANSMSDSNPAAVFTALARALSERGLAYLHVRETISGPLAVPEEQRLTGRIRELFRGRLLVNGGYDLDSGSAAVGSGLADAVVYGTLFLANPDLPRRFRERAPLNEPDPATFYDGEEKGYVDYPTLEESFARGGGS